MGGARGRTVFAAGGAGRRGLRRRRAGVGRAWPAAAKSLAPCDRAAGGRAPPPSRAVALPSRALCLCLADLHARELAWQLRLFVPLRPPPDAPHPSPAVRLLSFAVTCATASVSFEYFVFFSSRVCWSFLFIAAIGCSWRALPASAVVLAGSLDPHGRRRCGAARGPTMRPRNGSPSPSLDDLADFDPESAYYDLNEALAMTRALAARPPPFLRRSHGALRSTADGRWLPPPPPSSVSVSLLYVESATNTVDGLSASILRASGQRVRSTMVGIPAGKSGSWGSGGAADAATSATAGSSGLPLGVDGQPLPLWVSAKVDAGATGQQTRNTLADGSVAPAVTGTLPVMEHAAALGGPPLARLCNGGGATAAASAPSSSGAASALATRAGSGLRLSCALDDFDVWCDSTAEPSPVVGSPAEPSPTADSPVILRVSATGYAPTRLVLRRQRQHGSGRHRRLEGIVRLSLRRLRADDQVARGVAVGRRLVSASERRVGSLVVVARVEWRTPHITWPLARGVPDGAGVAVKDDSTPRRDGELPSQRMWRLSRHPVSSMAVRVDVRATTKKGVDLLKNHRRDLACPVCNVVVPRTGGAESAVTALNVVLAHMDAEHVRVRVEVENHSFTRPGRGEGGLSLGKGTGAPRPPLLFRASLLVTLRDRHPTLAPADHFFTRRHGPPAVAGGGAVGDCAATRDSQRRTLRRPRRASQASPYALERLSPALLPSPLSPAGGVRDARKRHRDCADDGTASAAAADKLKAGAAVAVRGKRKRTPPAGLSNVRLYRAGINIPLSEAEALHGDLYDMSDVRWLERLDTDRMLDVSDVTVREVYYMRLWNSFIRPSATGFGVYGDLHMRMALVAFMRTHRALLERLSMWGLVLSHLHELYALGVLDCAGLLAVARAYREPPEGGGGGGGMEKGGGMVDGVSSRPSNGVAANSRADLLAAMGSKAGGGLPAAVTGGEQGDGLPAVARVGGAGGSRVATGGGRGGGSSSARRAVPHLLSDATAEPLPTHPASYMPRCVASPSAGGRSGSGSSATTVLPANPSPTAPLRIVEVVDDSAFHAVGPSKAVLPPSAAATKVSPSRRDASGGVANTTRPSRVVSTTGASTNARHVSSTHTPAMEGKDVLLAGGRSQDDGASTQRLTSRALARAGAPARFLSPSRGAFAVEEIDVDATGAARAKRQRVSGRSAAAVAATVAPSAAAPSASGAAGASRRRASAASGAAADAVVVGAPSSSSRRPLPASGGSGPGHCRAAPVPAHGLPVLPSSGAVRVSAAASVTPSGKPSASRRDRK